MSRSIGRSATRCSRSATGSAAWTRPADVARGMLDGAARHRRTAAGSAAPDVRNDPPPVQAHLPLADRGQRREAHPADRRPRRGHLERRGRSRDLRPQERGARRALRRGRPRSSARSGGPSASSRSASGPAASDAVDALARDPRPAGRRAPTPGRGPPARPSPTPRRTVVRLPARLARGRRRGGHRRPADADRRRDDRTPGRVPIRTRTAPEPSLPLAPNSRRSQLMRAAVYEGEGRLVVRDVPDPGARPPTRS